MYFVSAKNQDCGRASPGGGGQDLLRQGLHHQAQVRGGEHRGGAARVHHLEEGEQDAQLRHREGRHQVKSCTALQTIDHRCIMSPVPFPFLHHSPLQCFSSPQS